MTSDSPGIKVTASDALEFEAVSPKVRKDGSVIKTLIFIMIFVALGSGFWAFYGDNIISIFSNSEDEISVIRADISPVKVRPEKPGGLQVPDRDKLVYSRIKNGGTETKGQATVERLLPLPETPLPSPSSAPLKTSQLSTPPPMESTPKVSDVIAAVKPTQAPLPPAVPSSAFKPDSIAPKPIPLSKSKTPVIIPRIAAAKSAVVAEPDQKKVIVNKVAKKPTPLTASETKLITAPSNSDYRVQLAAARSIKAARKEWDRLRLVNLDILGNLGSTITKYDSGTNGVFYRLRAGPLKKDVDARALCKTLAKRKTGCLVVRPGK